MKAELLEFSETDHRIRFMCPACKENHYVGIKGPVTWDWNQSLEAPTFSPSVLVWWSDTKRCHSFVRNGRIEFCGDCTHGFSGQTLELPELVP